MTERAPLEATSSGLGRRLLATIADRGPITFAEFMEAALYDPSEGFYSGTPVGEGSHFVTSPHVSQVFGILMARQVEEMWELLGSPDPFTVVEVGAGDGTLAKQVLEALSQPVRASTRYLAVERSAAARSRLERAGIEALPDVSVVSPIGIGCVLANELLDNLPFHRVRRIPAGLVELYVGSTQKGLVLQEGPLSSPALAGLAPDLPVGREWVVSPEAPRLLDQAGRVLSRGYVLILDYALGDPTTAPSIHGYRRHGVESDVLADPGSMDITAGVDFEVLRRHALAQGHSVWGPVSQREALLALGFRDLDRRAQERQREAIAARRGIEAMRIYSNRGRANMLVAAGGLGDFKVLCVGVRTDVPPRSVRASVW